jgi:hypothetical protein
MILNFAAVTKHIRSENVKLVLSIGQLKIIDLNAYFCRIFFNLKKKQGIFSLCENNLAPRWNVGFNSLRSLIFKNYYFLF